MPLALVAALAVTSTVRAEPPLLSHPKKLAAVAEIRRRILESVAAEKSAVLASTEVESKALVEEAKKWTAEADRARATLRELVEDDRRPAEIEALAAFDEASKALAEVDDELLDLAVANTNVAAFHLAGTEGAAALDRTVTAIGDMERASSNPGVLRDLSAAAISALLAQTVLLRHIPSADEAEMNMLDARIDELTARVDRILADAEEEDWAPPALTAAASTNWLEYRRILAEVLKLSRTNSDVKAFDLALHAKRDASRRCLEALDALEAAIETVPEATR